MGRESSERGEAFNEIQARALVLNSSYEPLKVVNWQKALILWFQDKVEVLEVHNEYARSVYTKFQLPSVIRLKKYVRIREHPKIRFSRENVYIRDGHRCQYCMRKFHARDLTLDHVIPASKGGSKDWTNIVTACRPCNQEKANQTLDEAQIHLRRLPMEPKWLPSLRLSISPIDAPEEWLTFLKREA